MFVFWCFYCAGGGRPEKPAGTHIRVDEAYVRQRVGPLIKNTDLARFIL
jgi:ATP-dependent protease HslVU (ClpYQ) ATPase subunit